jgi:hypothetical protein
MGLDQRCVGGVIGMALSTDTESGDWFMKVTGVGAKTDGAVKPLFDAAVTRWVEDLVNRVLGLPAGTPHLSFSVAEWMKLQPGGKNTPYEQIAAGHIPTLEGTGRAKRIPAPWVYAQLAQQIRAERQAAQEAPVATREERKQARLRAQQRTELERQMAALREQLEHLQA